MKIETEPTDRRRSERELETMATRRQADETIDLITKSIGAFISLAILGFVFDTLATATNIGVLRLLAGVSYLLMLGAVLLGLVMVGSLLFE